MKLFLIWQYEARGYDTYSDAVVAAQDEAEAKTIHPRSGTFDKCLVHIPLQRHEDGYYYTDESGNYVSDNEWTNDPGKVTAKYLGEAAEDIVEPMVICASFHAG